MHIHPRSLLLTSILLVPLVGSAQALTPIFSQSAPPSSTSMVNETPAWWFVELKGAPLADSGSPSALAKEKNDFRSAAQAAGISYTERFAFDRLWNGFSIEVKAGDLSKVQRLPQVANLYPVVTESVPPRSQEWGDLFSALAMTGASVAQNTLGYDGTGIKVAVMDTGIDIDHPDLGGSGTPGTTAFPSSRVIAGYDFVGNAFNADNTSPFYNPVTVPDPIPDDCNGHGTHVAGIVGANGFVTGVAPGVKFGAYRVFGCAGSTTADIMLAAMEMALADGMDVLNMSIGSAFQWPQYPTAEAANRLARHGMVVVASIGNSGAAGLYSAGAPGLGRDVIGVASVDNVGLRLRVFTISPDNLAIGYQQAAASPTAPTSGSLPMARTGTKTSTADACAALPAGSLTGRAALIRRGTCSFWQKAYNAQAAGAAAVVLYNNAPGRVSATVAGSPAITIPVVTISDVEGNLINDRLAATGEVTLTWTENYGIFANPTGNLASSFSSYGLSPDLSLKPDVIAPGGLIFSTYPLEGGGYATISGTSMSSPHVAGAVALLLEARPNVSRPMVKTLFQNTAGQRPWWGNPGLGFLDNVHRQGAGLINIPAAIGTTSSVTPSALALGESEAGPFAGTLTVANNGSAAVTYAVTHSPALSTGPSTFTPGFTTGFASVQFSSTSLSVPAGGTGTVTVTITANAGLANKSMYGGYLVFTPDNGGPALSVPYAGFQGDYQSIQALVPTALGFPLLAHRTGLTTYALDAAGTSYSMVGNDIPYILVHTDHQVRYLRLEVFDNNSGKTWHRAYDLDYFGRAGTPTGFYALPIDGTTLGGNKQYVLPNGSYVIQLQVLKALGDPTNPAHFETASAPYFTIARP